MNRSDPPRADDQRGAVLSALLSPQGQAALADAAALGPSEAAFLQQFERLARSYPRELARAALSQALLREKAGARFSRAGQMYFSRAGLEMATGERIARHRARRFAGLDRIADLACGIGGDLIGLGDTGAALLAVDRDASALAMARANLAACHPGAQADFVQADLTAFALPPVDAWFFDPQRREDGRRVHSVWRYRPPLRVLDGWLARVPAGGVKVSPGVKLDELAGFACEIEFTSVEGELKEAALWFGPLREAAPRRATLLPSGAVLAGEPDDDLTVPLSEPRAWLYEPDPAVLRAGLVQQVARDLDAAMLDRDIAYLTSDTLRPTPFARAFSIQAWMPFGLKRLRAWLRARDVGRVTVKKRGSPLDVDTLAGQLRLDGDPANALTLFLTQVAGRHSVLIGTPVEVERR